MKNFIHQFVELMRPRRRQFIYAALILMVFEVVKLAPPYLFKVVLDTLTSDATDKMRLVFLFAAGVLIAELVLACMHSLLVDRIILRILCWIEEYIPTKAQEKLLELSLGYHENEETGETIVQMERGTWKIADFVGNLLWHMFPLLIQTIATIIVMTAIDWQIASIFTLAIPVFVVMTWYSFMRTERWRKREEDLYTQSAGKLGESIINIKTVQAFAQEPYERQRYGVMREEINTIDREWLVFGTRMNLHRSIIINAARFGIITLAAYKALHGDISIGSVVLFLTLSEKVYISLFSLNQVMEKMLSATEPIARMFKLLQTKNKIVAAEHPVRPTSWRGQVEFRNLGFAYEEGRPVLDGINLAIEPGETIAFAGASGSGKSTLMKLFFRYYDPSTGGVMIDGHDLRELDLATFRQQTGYVPQDVEIMNCTMGENIAYGRPGASMQDIQRAARRAYLEDFIEGLPKRYDTLVGEGGVKLSGGQKQRVGVARALLVDPTFIVFDEATSNLDTASQRAVQKAIEKLSGTRTVIIIAHRLSTIMKADRIVVMDKGRIAEIGTHAELLRKNGLYQRLAKIELESD